MRVNPAEAGTLTHARPLSPDSPPSLRALPVREQGFSISTSPSRYPMQPNARSSKWPTSKTGSPAAPSPSPRGTTASAWRRSMNCEGSSHRLRRIPGGEEQPRGHRRRQRRQAGPPRHPAGPHGHRVSATVRSWIPPGRFTRRSGAPAYPLSCSAPSSMVRRSTPPRCGSSPCCRPGRSSCRR